MKIENISITLTTIITAKKKSNSDVNNKNNRSDNKYGSKS